MISFKNNKKGVLTVQTQCLLVIPKFYYLGEHFSGLADKQDKATTPSKPAPHSKIVELNSESEVKQAKSTPPQTMNPMMSETLYTRLPTGGADMSVRSSTNPNQPTAEDERRMQEIVANPEIRNILLDPKVMKLIESLKFNPDEGTRYEKRGMFSRLHSLAISYIFSNNTPFLLLHVQNMIHYCI